MDEEMLLLLHDAPTKTDYEYWEDRVLKQVELSVCTCKMLRWQLPGVCSLLGIKEKNKTECASSQPYLTAHKSLCNRKKRNGLFFLQPRITYFLMVSFAQSQLLLIKRFITASVVLRIYSLQAGLYNREAILQFI